MSAGAINVEGAEVPPTIVGARPKPLVQGLGLRV